MLVFLPKFKMKLITRTFITSIIEVAKITGVDETGVIKTEQLNPITVFNTKVDEVKAIKLAQKKYGKTNQYVILSISENEETLALELDKFLELAHSVNKKETVMEE